MESDVALRASFRDYRDALDDRDAGLDLLAAEPTCDRASGVTRTIASRHELAWVTANQGRWKQAEAAYRDVLDARRRVLCDEHPDTLTTRHELAWVLANQGRGREAESALDDILRARRRTLGDTHPATLTSQHELAWAIAAQGRWEQAEAAYRDVLAARRHILGDEHPNTLTVQHELAWTIAMQGRSSHSIERLHRGQTTPAYHPA